MPAQIATHALPHRKSRARKPQIQQPLNCPVAMCPAISMYEKELEKHRDTEAKLRELALREHALLLQKEELLRQKDTLSKESEHRLLNGLQMVTSILSIQSRAVKNAEVAAQLTAAANRVAAIGRVHRHLHTLDHVKSVEFKQYLESLCRDLAGMTSNRNLVVEGIELRIPTVTAIPLGFVANELITNAIKYAKGTIKVELRTNSDYGFALSVSDDGIGLPEGFDPTAAHGPE